MKHSLGIILVLLCMFFFTQLIGLVVISRYSPQTMEVVDDQGNVKNQTVYNLPYGMEPPQNINPVATFISIIIALIIAVIFMLLLMRYKVELVLRVWFLVVVILAFAISINAFIMDIPYSTIISLFIATPFAILKLFKRNVYIHNLTELLIYPGIAAIFVPLLNIWTIVLLLIIISIYDIYAVWSAGFMQKMAQYQIKNLKFFTGFFIPYLGKKERELIKLAKKEKSTKKGIKMKKIKVNIAILGGGDVVFPLMLSGVILNYMGFSQAIMISLGATLSLAYLFYISKKGKFYPAMPFITIGCLIALGIVFLL